MDAQPKRMTRREIAAELTKAGYPIAPATLATMATRGGGPEFIKWNSRALYDVGAAFAWAESRVQATATA